MSDAICQGPCYIFGIMQSTSQGSCSVWSRDEAYSNGRQGQLPRVYGIGDHGLFLVLEILLSTLGCSSFP